jgi:hypothetical protein
VYKTHLAGGLSAEAVYITGLVLHAEGTKLNLFPTIKGR